MSGAERSGAERSEAKRIIKKLTKLTTHTNQSRRGNILYPPGEMYYDCVGYVFGKKNMPKKRHLVEEVELEFEMAQRAIRKEKKLEDEGWGVVGV